MDAVILAGAMPVPIPGASAALGTPILGRPAGAYLLDTLVTLGIRRVVVVGGQAWEHREALGDADRWGIDLVSATGPLACLGESLASACPGASEDLLVLISDDPLLPPEAAAPLLATGAEGVLVGQDRSYGWRLLRRDRLVALVRAGRPARGLAAIALTAVPSPVAIPPLDQPHLLDWCRFLALDGWHARTVLLREIDRGVRVGPGAVIGAGSTLVGPCVVAAGASVGSGCTVGPDAYVGARALVCDGAVVEQAIIGDDTAVAPGRRIVGTACHGPVQLALLPGARTDGRDTIAMWEGDGGPRLRGALLAAALLVATAPLALLAALAARCPGGGSIRRSLVWYDGPGLVGRRELDLRWWRLPGWAAPLRWLGLHRWPLLAAVVRRRVGWTGAWPASDAAWRLMDSQERGVRQALGPGIMDGQRALLARGFRIPAHLVHQFLVTLPRRARRRRLDPGPLQELAS